MTLDEIVAGILEHIKDDDPKKHPKAKEVAQALLNKVSTVATLLTNRGAAGKGEEVKTQLGELKTRAEEAEAKVTELEEKLEAATTTTPPADWSQRFQDEKKRNETRENQLKTQVTTAEQRAVDAEVARVRDRFWERIKPRLKPIVHEAVKAKFESRIRPKDGKGPVEVLQLDEDQPYAVEGKEDPVDHLLNDALKAIEPEWILAEGKPGGGVGGGGGGGGAGEGKDLIDRSIENFNAQRAQTGFNPLVKPQEKAS
jgi:hypothetical protein